MPTSIPLRARGEKVQGDFVRFASSILFLVAIVPPSTYAFDGPLETKNQFPLFSQLNTVSFESARLENSNAASFSYSSIYFMKQSADWQASLDMEVAEVNIRMRRSFYDSFELGIEVPIVSFNAGFMDGAIERFHGLFGFATYGRQNRPENEFLYEVKRNGTTLIKGESDHAGLADVRLTAKKVLTSSDPFITMKLAVELPTGDAKKGYGNGNVGADLSLLLDKQIRERYMTYWNLGVARPGDINGYEKIKTKYFAFGGAGVETAIWDTWNILAQWTVQQSPYPKTGIRSVDSSAHQVTLGARYRGENGGNFDVTLAEDSNGGGVPDVTFSFSYKKKF